MGNSNAYSDQLSGNSQSTPAQITGSSYPNVQNTDNESSDDQVLRIFTASTPINTQTVVTIPTVMV